MEQLLGNSITYRIAVGPHAGCTVFTLQTLPACDPEDQFGDSPGRAVSEKRLSLTSGGKVRYQLKTPYRDGTTTHGVFAPNSKQRALVTPAKRGKVKKAKALDER